MSLFFVLLFTGVGLAMDAFAVSICKGLAMHRVNRTQTFIIGLFFGGFQALMPLLGWLLGRRFEKYITEFDHWIAFFLLAFIGGKMLFEAIKGGDEAPAAQYDAPLNIKELFVLAVATSIDALAVGISFAFLNYPIIEAVAVIGIVTFIISVAGVYIGNFFGTRYKKRAEIAGGIILILIGLKILLEHIGLIKF